MYGRAVELLDEGRQDEAFSAWLRAIESAPDELWVPAFRFWLIMQREKRNPDFVWGGRVLECFQRLQTEQPDSRIRALNCAEALFRHGRRELCRRMTRQAANLAVRQQPGGPPPGWREDAGEPLPPAFSVVGAMKCGTTSLYEYLIQHPRILPLAQKEVDFWSWKFQRDLPWFLAHFPLAPSDPGYLAGDACPTYFQYRAAPHRMVEAFPRLRILMVLRDPAARTISHHHHNARRFSDRRPLAEAVEAQIEAVQAGHHDPERLDNAVASSLYDRYAPGWLENFPREQVLVLFSEDLFADPPAVMNQVFEFLGLERAELRNAAPQNTGGYQTRDPATYQRLRDFFRPSVAALERQLGRATPWPET